MANSHAAYIPTGLQGTSSPSLEQLQGTGLVTAKRTGDGMGTTDAPLFMSFEEAPIGNRLGSFAASYALQAVMLGMLLTYAIVSPNLIPTQISHVELVAPAPDLSPKPERVKAEKTRPITPIPELLAVAPPKIQTPVIMTQQPQRVRRTTTAPELAQPEVAIAMPKFDSKVLNVLPGPKTTTKVVTNTSFGGSSATPTLQNIAPSKVQTGGFGDPNGVPVNAHGSGHSNIAAAGSFDLPSGSGYGNGTGGAKGARGTVASVGFGNSVAVQGGGGHGGNASQGHIQSAGFTPVSVAPANDGAHHTTADHQAASVPVSIKSKPIPVYTSEARENRVEGEVLVNVLFTADGKVRVLSIVRGLGYGLDEAAQRAVQGLNFTPALRDGHPVDSKATLHVIFQLS